MGNVLTAGWGYEMENSEFVAHGGYASFAEAATAARSYAKDRPRDALVRRSGDVWLVFIRLPTAPQISAEPDRVEDRDEFDDYDNNDDREEPRDQDEEEASIHLWSSPVAYGDHPFFVIYGD